MLVVLDPTGGLHQPVDGVWLMSDREWLSGDTTNVPSGTRRRRARWRRTAVAGRRFRARALGARGRGWPRAPRRAQLLDDLLQGRVVLPDDVVEMDGLHTGLLELLIGPPGLDGLMLAGVADQQHAVLRAETVEEVVHLSCSRGSTRRARTDASDRSSGALGLV